MASQRAPAPVREPSARPLHHSWIANREREGRAGARDVVDPATGEPFAAVSLLDEAQAGDAVAAARAAFDGWRALGFAERGRLLLRLRERILDDGEALSELIHREQGKPAAEAHVADVLTSLDALKHMALHAEDALRGAAMESGIALLAHKDARIAYEPLGAVLVITPWNYPFSISMTGIAPALAAGNTVVLKPAPATFLVGLRIGAYARDAGFPDGVVNLSLIHI